MTTKSEQTPIPKNQLPGYEYETVGGKGVRVGGKKKEAEKKEYRYLKVKKPSKNSKEYQQKYKKFQKKISTKKFQSGGRIGLKHGGGAALRGISPILKK